MSGAFCLHEVIFHNEGVFSQSCYHVQLRCGAIETHLTESINALRLQVSSEFYVREVLGMDREWGVLAWDVAGRGICYMCLEALAYLGLVSYNFEDYFFSCLRSLGITLGHDSRKYLLAIFVLLLLLLLLLQLLLFLASPLFALDCICENQLVGGHQIQPKSDRPLVATVVLSLA